MNCLLEKSRLMYSVFVVSFNALKLLVRYRKSIWSVKKLFFPAVIQNKWGRKLVHSENGY